MRICRFSHILICRQSLMQTRGIVSHLKNVVCPFGFGYFEHVQSVFTTGIELISHPKISTKLFWNKWQMIEEILLIIWIIATFLYRHVLDVNRSGFRKIDLIQLNYPKNNAKIKRFQNFKEFQIDFITERFQYHRL